MMDSSVEAALDTLFVKPFIAIDIHMANARLCLSDGLPEVTFVVNGNAVTFTDCDPIFGVCSSIDGWTDGIAEEAPSTSLTITPLDGSAIPILCDFHNQTKPINIYFGLIDDDTGAIIGDPELIYAGQFDVATIKASAETRDIEIDVISAWERFFNVDKGYRLNLRYQQSIHPGETGLKFMASTQDTVWWGSSEISSTVSKPPVSSLAAILNKSK